MKRLAIAALVTVVSAPIAAQAVGPAAERGDITITHGWFGSAPHFPVFGFFTINNRGPNPLLITSWQSPACRSLHLDEADGGGLDGMTIASKSRMAFARGGYHLACDGPTDAVKVGTTVPVTIGFQNGRRITAQFQIRDVSKLQQLVTKKINVD